MPAEPGRFAVARFDALAGPLGTQVLRLEGSFSAAIGRVPLALLVDDATVGLAPVDDARTDGQVQLTFCAPAPGSDYALAVGRRYVLGLPAPSAVVDGERSDRLARELNAARRELEQARAANGHEALREQLAAARAELTKARAATPAARSAELDAAHAELSERAEQAETELETARANEARAAEQAAALRTELAASHEREANARRWLEDELAKRREHNAALEQERDRLSDELREATLERERLSEEGAAACDDLTSERDRAQADAERRATELADVHAELEQARAEVARRATELTDVRGELARTERELDALTARHDALPDPLLPARQPTNRFERTTEQRTAVAAGVATLDRHPGHAPPPDPAARRAAPPPLPLDVTRRVPAEPLGDEPDRDRRAAFVSPEATHRQRFRAARRMPTQPPLPPQVLLVTFGLVLAILAVVMILLLF